MVEKMAFMGQEVQIKSRWGLGDYVLWLKYSFVQEIQIHIGQLSSTEHQNVFIGS